MDDDQAPSRLRARRVLVELHRIERDLVEWHYVRRVDALQGARDAIRALDDVGSPAGITERIAEQLGRSSQFDRVVFSGIVDGGMAVRGWWLRDTDSLAHEVLKELRSTPLTIKYPLVEAEVVQLQLPAMVVVEASGARAQPRLAELLHWGSYVVAPLVLHGKTAGLLHADAASSRRQVDSLDKEVLTLYADGAAQVFERAVRRDMLRDHRRELDEAVRWMAGRLNRLSAESALRPAGGDVARRSGHADLLTTRERQVLELLARGQTNVGIAKSLMVAEGTVKYHVKNILRKLGATSRSDAVSRYMRGSISETGG